MHEPKPTACHLFLLILARDQIHGPMGQGWTVLRRRRHCACWHSISGSCGPRKSYKKQPPRCSNTRMVEIIGGCLSAMTRERVRGRGQNRRSTIGLASLTLVEISRCRSSGSGSSRRQPLKEPSSPSDTGTQRRAHRLALPPQPRVSLHDLAQRAPDPRDEQRAAHVVALELPLQRVRRGCDRRGCAGRGGGQDAQCV